MFARIFVPAASVVTIGTVVAASSGPPLLLLPIFVALGFYAQSEKTHEEAVAAKINAASAQALQTYNQVRTPDMPAGVALDPLPSEAVHHGGSVGPNYYNFADIKRGTPVLKRIDISNPMVITLARSTDCWANDFVGVHVSTEDREHWTFLGVGPQSGRFTISTSGTRYVLITPLHHQICSNEEILEYDGARPYHAGYWNDEVYKIWAAAPEIPAQSELASQGYENDQQDTVTSVINESPAAVSAPLPDLSKEYISEQAAQDAAPAPVPTPLPDLSEGDIPR